MFARCLPARLGKVPIVLTMAANNDFFKASNAKYVEEFAKTGDGAKPLPPARKVRARLVSASGLAGVGRATCQQPHIGGGIDG